MVYFDNHALALPDRVPGPPKWCHEWYNHGSIRLQEEELLERIAAQRSEVTAGKDCCSEK